MLNHRQHSRVQPNEPQQDAARALPLLRFRQHLERRVLEIEHTGQIERHDLRLRFGDQGLHLLADVRCIRKENATLGTQHEQPGKGLVLGMLLGTWSEHVGARLAPQHVKRRVCTWYASATSETTIATRIPRSGPSSTTPTRATKAHKKSVR